MNFLERNASRRKVLKRGFASLAVLSAGPMLSACHRDEKMISNIANVGPLSTTPDANGLLLPPGFSSRVLARTLAPPVASSSYIWHSRPDGGATFQTASGGWIYVSNSEVDDGAGGVGALEFDSAGNLIDAFALLEGTSMNCAGGPTPWGTWLSCEEYDAGTVWETYPLDRGATPAVQRPAMGVFQHEAAAVDPATSIVYMTEDQGDGCLYRFLPDSAGDLSRGTLQVAVVDQVDENQRALEGMVSWVDVPDPSGATMTVRAQSQALGAGTFIRGEGIYYHDGVVYIAMTANTTTLGVVWAYEIASGALTQIYNRTDLYPGDTSLNGIDNLTVSAGGDVIVAEDTDDMQIQALTPDGVLVPLLKVTGQSIFGFNGELTGPSFDPSGTRLYFSSQRGTEADFGLAGEFIGLTYEVTGPFVI